MRASRKGSRLRKSKHSSSRSAGLKEDSRTVTCSFAGNQYIGTLRQDTLGARSLEGQHEKYTWSTGVHYEGPLVGSQVEGRGKFHWPDGSTYEGEISNGKRHGEGVYVAADGVTRYEGQWREGKRHGRGRLTYDPSGEAFYEGQWEDGAKHGDGRQVWLSRNHYEGQWRYGRMAGQGTMTWHDGDMIEQYCGNWEDDHPEGQGTHTWYANESPVDLGSKAMPSQQMNNRYEGGWHDGVRHGKGTFSYANGARYHGDWDNNVKQGDGRYTFEDGRVYCGPFDHDQMTANTEVPATATGRPLNIGNEDNPVRRCIDIADLEPLALPVDVGPQDFDIGSGYDEEHEVMREVHNMLLRYLGELKQCYAHYKSVLPRPGADPFVLSSHQFWAFCRDIGTVTPSCSLSRLNRMMRAGHRHHQEVAYEDLEDLRPLTPAFLTRHSQLHRRSTELLDPQQEAEAGPEPEVGQQEASEAGEERDMERDVEESSVYSSTQNSHGTPEDLSRMPTIDADMDAEPSTEVVEQEENPVQPSPSCTGSRSPTKRSMFLEPTVYPLYSKFWREEGGPNLTDVHDPSGMMIFRHFLEGIVRLSLSRYPLEKGLEHQLRRLFKESILPKCRMTSTSDTFEFLVHAGVQEVLDEFHPALWRLFKENAVGEGAYDRPHWISLVEAEPKPAEKEEGAEEGAEEANAPDEALPCSQVLPPLESRATRRGFGGQQRRVHLRAHLDVTVRVKDMLKLFDGAGLLQPLSECNDVPKAQPAYEPVFPLPCSRGSNASMGKIEGLQGLEAMLMKNAGATGDAAPAGPVAAQGSKEDTSTPNVLASLRKQMIASSRSATNQSFFAQTAHSAQHAAEDGAEKSAMGRQISEEVPPSTFRRQISEEVPPSLFRRQISDDGQAVETECGSSATGDDMADAERALPAVLQEQCNLRMSFYDLLRIALEVCLPEASSKLHWAVREEGAGKDQVVALLDYLETELCYAEFLRILVRFAERQTEQVNMIGCLPLHKRLEGFVRHVFVPSLRAPYKPPPAPEPEKAEGEDRDREQAEQPPQEAPSPAPAPKAPSPAPPPEKPQGKTRPVAKGAQKVVEAHPPEEPPAPQEEEPPKAPPPPKPLVFWRGFEEDEAMDVGAVVTPRCWPDGYDQEILDW